MPAKKSTIDAIAPRDLREVGHAWGGTYWQEDMAQATGWSKSQISRCANGSRTADYQFVRKLKGLLIQRIENIAHLFSRAPFPEHASQRTRIAQQMILSGLAMLKEGDAILSDWKPKAPAKRGGGQFVYGPKHSRSSADASSEKTEHLAATSQMDHGAENEMRQQV